jgi:hypothetical protein
MELLAKFRASLSRPGLRFQRIVDLADFFFGFNGYPLGWFLSTRALHRLFRDPFRDQTGVPPIEVIKPPRPRPRQYGAVLVAAVILTVMVVSGCGGNSKKVQLAMKFRQGSELVWEQTSDQKITLGEPEQLSSQSRSKGEMTQKVEEVLPDGSARVDEASTWSWSEKDSNNTIKVVSRTENLSYNLAANGKISALELPTEDKEAQWKEYAQSNLEQSQPTFPEEPVSKGYTWMQTVKVFMPSGEKLDASTTYRVTDFVNVDGHKCAVIDYTGNLILPFDVMESDTLTSKGVDRVDVTGTLWFDYENGYVFSQQEKDKVTAERSKVLANQATRYTAFIENEIYFHLKSNK